MLKKISYYLLMLLLAILIGILASIGALFFKMIVAFIHNLFFLGQLSFNYNEILHTPPSPWGFGIILVPVLGGVIVIWLIESFAQAERGLSVPEIMHKIYSGDGRVSPIIALTKTLASAISIGSGASIGREGPIIQIGASISSLLSDVVNLSS